MKSLQGASFDNGDPLLTEPPSTAGASFDNNPTPDDPVTLTVEDGGLNKIVLTYPINIREDIGSPDNADYTPAGGNPTAVTSTQIIRKVVTLTVDDNYATIDTITLTYVKASAQRDLRNTINTKVADLTTESVTNNIS